MNIQGAFVSATVLAAGALGLNVAVQRVVSDVVTIIIMCYREL